MRVITFSYSVYHSNWFVEDTLWTGTPGNYTNPNAPEALKEVRELVDNGNYSEATAAAAKLTGNPAEVCYFSLLGSRSCC